MLYIIDEPINNIEKSIKVIHPNVHCTMYTVQCTLYNVHCTMYTVQCTLYNVHCTMYTVQCTLYNVHCTMYTVQCTTDLWWILDLESYVVFYGW